MTTATKCPDPDCLLRDPSHDGPHKVYPGHPKTQTVAAYREALRRLLTTAHEVTVPSPDSDGVVYAMNLDAMESAYALLGYKLHDTSDPDDD